MESVNPKGSANSIKHLTELLKSKKQEDVLRAIQAFSTKGNKDTVLLLLDAALRNPKTEIKSRVFGVLDQLKDSEAQKELLRSLTLEKYASLKKEILSSVWNAGVDVNDQIHLITQIAIDSDYESCIECLTIIDTIDPPVNEESVAEAQFLLGEYMNSSTDHPAMPLLKSILARLNELSQYS